VAASAKTKYPCDHHRDRIEAVVVGDRHLCWECYLGPDEFAARFPADFYDTLKKASF
jgi:hypothetical protein